MTKTSLDLAQLDFDTIATALGPPAPVAYAAAHAYPASAPAYETRPHAICDGFYEPVDVALIDTRHMVPPG